MKKLNLRIPALLLVVILIMAFAIPHLQPTAPTLLPLPPQ